MSRTRFLAGASGAALLAMLAPASAQQVESVTVTAQRLDDARNGIQTQTGASTYTITAQAIDDQPGGDNEALNSVILQAPGVAQDSFGQLHIRGEHNGLQYRINGIILPEGISVFGQTLDPRLADSVRLITGALPAEYGNRTAGIIDIQTKTGLFDNGGEISMYGGSHNTLSPSIAYGGSSGNFNYFVSGDYTTNSLGIESPDGSADPLHDRTSQYHGFAFAQNILDQNSSVTAVLGTSNAIFQIPNQNGLQPAGLDGIVGLGPLSPDSGDFQLSANGVTAFPSNQLDERQRESTDYGILSYLRSQGSLDLQVSLFGRFSSLFFTPGDNVGDLLYDGNAQTAYKRDIAYGVQAEGAWHLGSDHTLRFGLLYQGDDIASDTSSLVLPTAAGGPGNPNPNPLCADPAQICQTSGSPFAIADDSSKHASAYGAYLQDEWKLLPSLTLNYGLRYDQYQAFASQDQLSPRANLVWTPTDTTTIHGGYARYFSPPPIELVATTDIARFDNSTAAGDHTDDTPLAERADYYDVGVSQKLFDTTTIGFDSFYKASHDLIDEGQFGAPIILTPFNYQNGRQYGGELTANYQDGDFNAYANAAYERAVGRDIVSSQFQFSSDDLSYIATHYIPLDHQQLGSVSAGASYKWQDTVFSTDLLYGTGLRRDGATPNGDHVPAYVTANFGVSHSFDIGGTKGLTARLDLINAFDEKYEIRDGTGVGVGAPQFGAGRGVFSACPKAFRGRRMTARKNQATVRRRQIGRRIRLRRLFLNRSQTGLAKALGITYQLLQKYEKGETAVPEKRLAEIELLLDLPQESLSAGHAATQSADAAQHFVESADGIALNRAVAALPPAARAGLLMAVGAYCDGHTQPEDAEAQMLLSWLRYVPGKSGGGDAAKTAMEAAKAELARAFGKMLRTRKMTQAFAARILHTSQARISTLARGDVRGVSLEKLLCFFVVLGWNANLDLTRRPVEKPGRIRIRAKEV